MSHNTWTLPATPRPPKKSRPWWKKKRYYIPGALLLVGVLIPSNSGVDDKPDATPVETVSPLTAQRASEVLAKALGFHTLGDPQDNTGFCNRGDEAMGCTQLITTDRVSIYQFRSSDLAMHWVDNMKRQDHDWRQVENFALVWDSRDQKVTSEECRTELVAALKGALAQGA